MRHLKIDKQIKGCDDCVYLYRDRDGGLYCNLIRQHMDTFQDYEGYNKSEHDKNTSAYARIKYFDYLVENSVGIDCPLEKIDK